jgi:hypothetical protein
MTMPRSPRQGYEVYDGNGEVNGLVSTSMEGETSRNQPSSGTYIINSDCTGRHTDGTYYDLFIAPDGSMFTFVLTNPGFVVSGFEMQGTAKRVSD